MSEQEKKSGGSIAGASIVMMEQTMGSRHKTYRSNELQEEGQELHHKRSRAPAVPSVAEELKDTATNERKEIDKAASEKIKPNVAKKVSSKRRGSSPETITLAPMEVGIKRESLLVQPQPIPSKVQSVASRASGLSPEKAGLEKKDDTDSITEEIAEVRTPEVAKKHSEWSDEEEAGGLPRTESRGSRVSRAMRQLFCCGVRYETPSEDDVSSRREYTTGI